MKKGMALLLAVAMILCLCACGGDISRVKIGQRPSQLYSDQEIFSAIGVIISYFKVRFTDCTLRDICYIGDEKNSSYNDFALRHCADDVIVLVSSFDVGPSGGDGSLNPNDTYRNWKWILVRSGNGKWKHVDHGY